MEVVPRRRAILWMLKRRTALLLAGFIVIMLLLVLWPRMVFVIESGHAGVVYRTFWGGTVTENVRDEGLQIIMPWNTLTIYDVRLQEEEQQFTVISNDGLEIHVTLTIRYAPKIELLGLLHKKIGPDYLRKIVIPDVHSLIRTTFGQYSPEEIYRTKRSLIQETFQSALSNLGEKYVEMDDLLIKSIELPEMIKTAIENKHVEQQLMLQMHFRIDRERLEAQRKEIEADGVERFQSIVSRSLTPQLLQYKGIEAMTKLAQSPNSKLVLAGGGSNGVPLILDTTTGAPFRDQTILGGEAGTRPLPDADELPSMLDQGGNSSTSPMPWNNSREELLRWFQQRKKKATTPASFPSPTLNATPAATPADSPQPEVTPLPALAPPATPAPTPTGEGTAPSRQPDGPLTPAPAPSPATATPAQKR